MSGASFRETHLLGAYRKLGPSYAHFGAMRQRSSQSDWGCRAASFAGQDNSYHKIRGRTQNTLEIARRSAQEASPARTVTLLAWLSRPRSNSGKGPSPAKANA